MRLFKLSIISFLAGFLFVACGDDDNGAIPPPPPVILPQPPPGNLPNNVQYTNYWKSTEWQRPANTELMGQLMHGSTGPFGTCSAPGSNRYILPNGGDIVTFTGGPSYSNCEFISEAGWLEITIQEQGGSYLAQIAILVSRDGINFNMVRKSAPVIETLINGNDGLFVDFGGLPQGQNTPVDLWDHRIFFSAIDAHPDSNRISGVLSWGPPGDERTVLQVEMQSVYFQ